MHASSVLESRKSTAPLHHRPWTPEVLRCRWVTFRREGEKETEQEREGRHLRVFSATQSNNKSCRKTKDFPSVCACVVTACLPAYLLASLPSLSPPLPLPPPPPPVPVFKTAVKCR
ncbi:hypothetical protein E2C01_077749 [Portunus trituberculatus]|uniref:Uncharacterized protein n=1 Tax=Portunus trituberculatus TaxID=210409 RepID=A0A5B7IM48_PORTR|nr:hypothetical protein [Portunus trituberculatus]